MKFLFDILPFKKIFIFGCAEPFLLCKLSLVALSESYSLGAMHELLLVVASLNVEHGL